MEVLGRPRDLAGKLPGIPDSSAFLRRWSPGGPLSLPRGGPQSHSHRVRPGPYAAYEPADGPCRLGSLLSTTNLHLTSFPNPDFKHRITVQASPGLDRRRNVFEVGAGDSPTFPRFRAIQCKKPRFPIPFP